MAIVDEHGVWVNKEVEFQERRAALLESQGSAFKAAKHRDLANNLKSILADLQSALSISEKPALSSPPSHGDALLTSALPDGDAARAVLSNPLSITPEHLKGLPQELIAQISISETDRFEANVAHLVGAAAGSTMLLDNIMIGLYLMTKETHQRQTLANKLYRMTKKGLLFSVPGRKGYYTTVRPENAEDSEIGEAGDDEQ